MLRALQADILLLLSYHGCEKQASYCVGGIFKPKIITLQFPDCYEEAVIKLVHHATLKEDELSQRVISYFKDRFVSGETVFGIKDGQEKNCRIVAPLDPLTAGHDCKSIL